jgi:hypothetical protein
LVCFLWETLLDTTDSIYDKDKEKILHLCGLGLPLNTIVKTHLGYGNTYYLKNLSKKEAK